MGNIVLLDDLTINKIAAGEVVERPASVIKEMVENSIDANATNINIEIQNGGISYIRITDNGKGIAKDDMEMAFERHATSKIRSASDLDVVKSMGFRGEALASIAAIAKVEMISKTEQEQVGNRIVVEAGNVLVMEEAGVSRGTTITVQNLFFNTPVRYKFLKKDYTESGYIEDVVTRLALVNPHISFRLISSGKTIIQTSGNGSLQDVIYAIYGKDIASNVVEVDDTYEDIHIRGVVGKPEIARSNRSNQIFFVNKRCIKDKTLSSAAENSFKGLLPIGKYGFLILNLEMDPSKVDVNVHPAKLEVRFQEENKVFKAIYHIIKDTLLKAELIANVEKAEHSKQQKEYIDKNKEKPTITDLFRKIRKEDSKERQIEEENNVIADIFEKKENSNIQQSNSSQRKNFTDKDKMDVFNELIAVQQKLKQEVEQDPRLHTNIDTLISSTQKMGIMPKEEKVQEIKKDIQLEPIKDEAKIENIAEGISDENKHNLILEQTSQSYEFVSSQDTKQEEKTSLYSIEDNPSPIKDNPKNEQLKVNDVVQTKQEQETRTFTNEEIQEMMDKLRKMENVEQNPEFESMYEKIFGNVPASVKEEKEKEKEKINAYEIMKQDSTISIFEEIPEYQKPTYKLVGIAFNTYIIIEIQKELYIIDQHAAHERVMYEKVKQNYYSGDGKDSQMLLLPDIITLTHKEMDILKDNDEMFLKAGFVFEEFGDNTIKLTGVPNICLDLDTKELFLETLDEINTVARTAKQEIEEKFIATVACKAAVKAHMDLTPEEVDCLMNDLLKLPNPFTCPHGRPTAIRMDKDDIEKKFARRK